MICLHLLNDFLASLLCERTLKIHVSTIDRRAGCKSKILLSIGTIFSVVLHYGLRPAGYTANTDVSATGGCACGSFVSSFHVISATRLNSDTADAAK